MPASGEADVGSWQSAAVDLAALSGGPRRRLLPVQRRRRKVRCRRRRCAKPPFSSARPLGERIRRDGRANLGSGPTWSGRESERTPRVPPSVPFFSAAADRHGTMLPPPFAAPQRRHIASLSSSAPRLLLHAGVPGAAAAVPAASLLLLLLLQLIAVAAAAAACGAVDNASDRLAAPASDESPIGLYSLLTREERSPSPSMMRGSNGSSRQGQEHWRYGNTHIIFSVARCAAFAFLADSTDPGARLATGCQNSELS